MVIIRRVLEPRQEIERNVSVLGTSGCNSFGYDRAVRIGSRAYGRYFERPHRAGGGRSVSGRGRRAGRRHRTHVSGDAIRARRRRSSPPGVLEQEIGKFIERRVQLRNAEGELCRSRIDSVGEDPTNPYDAKIVLRFDCKGVPGQIFYDPGRLLRTQGARGKHLVSIGEMRDAASLTEAQRRGAEPAPGQVMIFPVGWAGRSLEASALAVGDRAEILRGGRRAHHDRL